MAQRRRQVRAGRARQVGLSRRLGLAPGRGVVLALALIAVVFGAWGYLSSGARTGVTVERAIPSDASAGQESDGQGVEADGTQAQADTGQDSATAASQAEPTRVLIHVDGAVASPGVYALALADPRVEDAVEAAGGLAQDADTTSLNLAAPVADGTKVHVPRQGEASQGTSDTAGSGTGAGAASASGTASSASSPGGLININTASEAELQALPGVGQATAAAIVKDREANGAFTSKEDLMRVSGIGEKKFAKVRDLICV